MRGTARPAARKSSLSLGGAGTPAPFRLEDTLPRLRSVYQAELERQAETGQAAAAASTTAAPPHLPDRRQPSLSDEQIAANRASNEATVDKLRALLREHRYNLPPGEAKALTKFDKWGNVDATCIVDGFPVNADNSWADPAGKKLAESMVAHAVQLGAAGLLDGDDSFVRIDICPTSAHWKAGKALDKELMHKVAGCAAPLALVCMWVRPCLHRSWCATLLLRRRLILKISWSHEVLAFGEHAIQALRTARGVSFKERGLDYGLAKKKYAVETRPGNRPP